MDKNIKEGPALCATPAGASPEDLLADYASKQTIAGLFAVSERTVERWVRLRILPPPVRLGRTGLYHVPTLRQHLADRALAAAGALNRRGGSRS
jgi:hypothetical protein